MFKIGDRIVCVAPLGHKYSNEGKTGAITYAGVYGYAIIYDDKTKDILPASWMKKEPYMFKVGDKVRYTGKHTPYLSTELYGKIGTVTRLDSDKNIFVNFGGKDTFKGVYPQNLELVKEETTMFNIGDKVIIYGTKETTITGRDGSFYRVAYVPNRWFSQIELKAVPATKQFTLVIDGVTLTGAESDVLAKAQKLGFNPDNGTYYHSESKGLVRIDTMDHQWVKNAILKMLRKNSIKGLSTNPTFVALVNRHLELSK